MSRIFYGQPLADQITESLKQEIEKIVQRQVVPHLAVIVVGDNPASQTYTNLKRQKAESLGIHVTMKIVPASISEAQLLALIRSINQDPNIHGILVQMPLPDHINREKIVWTIQPKKDVDGFQIRDFLPPAPMAIIELLKYYGVSVTRKKVTIVGTGFLIGKPLTTLMTRYGARVTVADETTRFLQRRTEEADILISATGRGHLIGQNYVREKQIVVDAGGEWVKKLKVKSEKLKVHKEPLKFIGEVKQEEVEPIVEALVPNPGGIGPVTIALLLKNVVLAAKKTVIFKR